jgi:hypothetical protein
MIDDVTARRIMQGAGDQIPVHSPPVDALVGRGRAAKRRQRALTYAGTALSVLALFGVVTLANGAADRTTPSPQFATQLLDSQSAPAEVVRAYVEALNRGREEDALGLLTPERAEAVKQQEGALRPEGPVDDLRLERPDSTYPREAGGTAADNYKHAVFIRASYESGGDTVMTGFLLVRDDQFEVWRIADEGPA